MDYARGIRFARRRAGLSKRGLARAAGLNAGFVTHLESGQKQPSVQTLEAIAGATRIPVAAIMLMSSDDADLRHGLGATHATGIAERMIALSRSLEERDGADGGDDNGGKSEL